MAGMACNTGVFETAYMQVAAVNSSTTQSMS
jgi:hypothetical protein